VEDGPFGFTVDAAPLQEHTVAVDEWLDANGPQGSARGASARDREGYGRFGHVHLWHVVISLPVPVFANRGNTAKRPNAEPHGALYRHRGGLGNNPRCTFTGAS
jgi:hypothetical protein